MNSSFVGVTTPQPPIMRPNCAAPSGYRHNDNVARMNTSKSEAGAVLGSSKSQAKTKAAQNNGAKGGRPEGS